MTRTKPLSSAMDSSVKLPDEVKKSLVAGGLGEPLTQILSQHMPSDGIGAYPCLVLKPTSGKMEIGIYVNPAIHNVHNNR